VKYHKNYLLLFFPVIKIYRCRFSMFDDAPFAVVVAVLLDDDDDDDARAEKCACVCYE
jgi:hypothetical protein